MRLHLLLVATCLFGVNSMAFAGKKPPTAGAKMRKEIAGTAIQTKNGEPVISKKSKGYVDLKKKRYSKE